MIYSIGYSQENPKELQGIVTYQNESIADILIVNKNSDKSTITNQKGFFSIEVQSKDTLQLSAVHYKTKEIIITDEILDQRTFYVELEKKIIDLEEVVLQTHQLTGHIHLDINRIETQPVITSSDLGLPKANIKVKTKNERLLFEADEGKLIHFYVIAATLNITKLLNKISGRTKKLKKHIRLDNHIKIEDNVDKSFSNEVLSEKLKIPKENIQSFLDFCINQSDFPKYSETLNSLEILEYLESKSQEYKNANGLN